MTQAKWDASVLAGTTDTSNWDEVKLRRKANQHWHMAGLARADHDPADEKRHTDLARAYERILVERRNP